MVATKSKQKKIRYSLVIEPYLIDNLKAESVFAGISSSEFIRDAIKRSIKRCRSARKNS